MDVEFPAEMQVLTSLMNGTYRLSEPLCHRHVHCISRAEDVAIYEIEPTDWGMPPECQPCVDEGLDASEPIK